MPATEHAEVVALLSDPATHGGAPVEVRRTHAALVFLAGDTALKVKRPVRYGYLDFTDPATRREMLARELALNAAAAPGIYDRLLPVTREADGRLALDGTGAPVEWALRMRRFPQSALLEAVAREGRLDMSLAAALGARIAAYHAAAPRRDGDGAAMAAAVLSGLSEGLAAQQATLGAAAVGRFAEAARAALARVAPLLQARAEAGFLRRCHGDLHLANLVLIDGAPVPFDALEFDEALGTMDVLYDLAFLLMDLCHAGHRPAANRVLNRWLERTAEPAHLDGLAALPLWLALRAAIRAMVTAQRVEGADDAAAARRSARRYLRAALGYLAPVPARLVAVGGLSGSGKSTLAAALAPGVGPAPGAVHLRSDVLRKTLAGVEETDRLPPESYSCAAAAEVYAGLRDRAARALAAGHGVVLDAVHLNAGERQATAALAAAAEVDFAGLWLEAPAEALQARVARRRGDASDAGPEVVRAQLAAAPVVADWPHVSSSGGAARTLRRARRLLTGGDGPPG